MKRNLLTLGLMLSWNIFSPTTQAEPVAPELQTAIIRLYSEGRCDGVRALEPRINPNELRPNVLAIYAACEPPHQDAEKLFQMAEQKNPTGDLILVLHGRFRYKLNPESSEEIWQKVLLLARNAYFRDLAHAYLSKVVDPETNAEALDLSPDTTFARVTVGSTYRDHTNPNEFAFAPTHSSLGSFFRGDLRFRRWTSWGSIGAFFSSQHEQYSQGNEFNYWSNALEVPVALHVTPTKDLIFRPLLDYQILKGQAYKLNYGLGLRAAVYQSEYVQSVEALIFAQRIFSSLLTPEQGAHYRFEYTWDFYSRAWTISTQFAMEHVSSSNTSFYLGHAGSFELSHNDLSVNLKFRREYAKFSLGFDPSFLIRLDTQASTYVVPSSSNVISEGREDFELRLNENLTIPLSATFVLYFWYEWDRIYSTLGSSNYVDRNFKNQILGLALKASFSSY